MKTERVTVTPAEIKNGWDDASLRKYLESRNEVQAQKIDPRHRQVRPNEQNHRYKPHRWRE